MKKVIIIGGGIAGLSAGVFGKKSGYEVEIFEMHSIPGGECTGWTRGGYHFDNCIHWLTGTKKSTDLYKVWKEIGALENVQIESFEYFSSYNYEGKTLYLYKDLKKLKEHFIELSPEDEKEIIEFINIIEDMSSCTIPTKKPMEMMNILDYLKLAKSYGKASKHISKLDKISLEEYSMRFKSPIIRKALTNVLPGGYAATPLFFTLGGFSSGDGAWVKGGSLAMSLRIANKFKDLGGKINLNSKVKRVVIENNEAKGIELENGQIVKGDYVISAIDSKMLLDNLLEGKYEDNVFDNQYNNPDKYHISSSVDIGLGIKCDLSERDHQATFEVEPFKCAIQEVNKLTLKHYCYEKKFAPNGSSVLRTSIMCEDYEYWKKLKKENKKKYYEEKDLIAKEIIKRIEKIYPEIIENIEVYDVCTPVTYEKYCGAYKGAWMAFAQKAKVKNLIHKGRIKNISNLHIASQWVMMPGGLPVACLSGKWAIQRICTKEKSKFYFEY